MKIVIDYRPALRARTGVGEYVHELTRAYRAHAADEVTLFTSSWKDRPRLDAAVGPARVVDRRIPVRVLNYLWHRWQWPPIETLAGGTDVVHALHPLLIPARRAAQVVTIHDLYFLSHPEQTRAEIRRDYVKLARLHARRADAIVTPSTYTKRQIVDRFDVPPERVHVCPFGRPAWHAAANAAAETRHGYFLFVGTLIARKNVATLLDAYARLLERHPTAPPLKIVGGAGREAGPWLARIRQAPLAGKVEHLGYVPEAGREGLYAGAHALIMPSLDEGFGVPALEAMSAGVPVIASNRGALPEVVGDGGMLLDAEDAEGFAAAMARTTSDPAWAQAQRHAGLRRAQAFDWTETATRLRRAYLDAIERRRSRQ